MKKMNKVIAACSAMLLASGASAVGGLKPCTMKLTSCNGSPHMQATATEESGCDINKKYKDTCSVETSKAAANACANSDNELSLNNEEKKYDVSVVPGNNLYTMFPDAEKYTGESNYRFNLTLYNNNNNFVTPKCAGIKQWNIELDDGNKLQLCISIK